MASPAFVSAMTLSGAAGVASHLCYFIGGEHHREIKKLLGLTFAIPVTITAIQIHLLRIHCGQANVNTISMMLAYFAALFVSMGIYRLYVRPLRDFPGPRAMRVSKLVHVLRSRKLDNYLQLESLRQEYGDFVRTGPNELTIFRPDAHIALHGPQSRCTKAVWYDMTWPTVSLQTTRDRADHNRRRRIWDRAFSVKAINGYEPRVVRHINELERKLATGKQGRHAAVEVDVTNLFNFLIFDIMGDVSFGVEFNLVKTGKMHFAIEKMRAGMVPVGILSPVPWLFRMMTAIPGVLRPWNQLLRWCREESTRRLKEQPENPDLFSWLIGALPKESTLEASARIMEGDALLAIVAGSETTATALTFLFYHLARDPIHIQIIRNELQSVEDIRSNDGLHALPYLNACITETLRLHPPTPSGLMRQTPAEGIYIGDTYIPGHVTCVAPTYSIARLESCFEKANDFLPERWIDTTHLVRNKTGYAPFSIGPYSCVGKNMALMELRIATAVLVTTFDVAFAPDETGEELLGKMHDHFTVTPGPLRLNFTER